MPRPSSHLASAGTGAPPRRVEHHHRTRVDQTVHGQRDQAAVQPVSPCARTRSLACSYDTTAATAATPSTAPAVDHLMTRSAALIAHHRQAQTRRSGGGGGSLGAVAPRTHIHDPDLRLFALYTLTWTKPQLTAMGVRIPLGHTPTYTSPVPPLDPAADIALDPATLGRRHPAPRTVVECLSRSSHGAVNVLGAAFGDTSQGLAGRGVGSLECLAGGCVRPLPVNEQLPRSGHEGLDIAVQCHRHG